MAKKEITIAFRNGGTIPAAVLKTQKDVRVPAHEPISVPEAYGRHLIEDRFAYEADAKLQPLKKGSPAKASEADLTEAETAVVDARAAVEAAGDDLVAKADAEANLKAAEDALAALKG